MDCGSLPRLDRPTPVASAQAAVRINQVEFSHEAHQIP